MPNSAKQVSPPSPASGASPSGPGQGSQGGVTPGTPQGQPSGQAGNVRLPGSSSPSYVPGQGLKDEKGRIVAHDRVPGSTDEFGKTSMLAGLTRSFSNVNKRVVFMIFGGIFLIAGSYFVMRIINRDSEVVIETPIPRASRTPGGASKTDLNAIFGTISRYDYRAEVFKTEDVYREINGQGVSKGQFRRFNLIAAQTSKNLSSVDIFEALASEYPSELKQYLGEDSISLIYGQKEVLDSLGGPNASGSLNRLVLISEVTDLPKLNETLTIWATKIAPNLSPVLNYDRTAAINSNLAQVTYSGIVIRYANFPYPDKTIDYAVVPASNKKNYFVVTNSRESMRAAIDKLRAP
jgi:hypothetical protein